MPDEEKEKEQVFKVTDRRKFTAEGEVRLPEPGESPPEAPRFQDPLPRGREGRPEPKGPGRESRRREPEGEPESDFSSFLLSIATTALVHLGEIPDPATNRRHENPAVARQMIDTLGMLQSKTQGNLTAEEENLLENLLYELRMKFVGKSGGSVRL